LGAAASGSGAQAHLEPAHHEFECGVFFPLLELRRRWRKACASLVRGHPACQPFVALRARRVVVMPGWLGEVVVAQGQNWIRNGAHGFPWCWAILTGQAPARHVISHTLAMRLRGGRKKAGEMHTKSRPRRGCVFPQSCAGLRALAQLRLFETLIMPYTRRPRTRRSASTPRRPTPRKLSSDGPGGLGCFAWIEGGTRDILRIEEKGSRLFVGTFFLKPLTPSQHLLRFIGPFPCASSADRNPAFVKPALATKKFIATLTMALCDKL
jgi:hypothetical protein